jgi:hypothetical protein
VVGKIVGAGAVTGIRSSCTATTRSGLKVSSSQRAGRPASGRRGVQRPQFAAVAYVVIAGDLAIAASFQHHGGDHELRLRHGRPPRLAEVPTMSRDRCQLCREIRHCQPDRKWVCELDSRGEPAHTGRRRQPRRRRSRRRRVISFPNIAGIVWALRNIASTLAHPVPGMANIHVPLDILVRPALIHIQGIPWTPAIWSVGRIHPRRHCTPGRYPLAPDRPHPDRQTSTQLLPTRRILISSFVLTPPSARGRSGKGLPLTLRGSCGAAQPR